MKPDIKERWIEALESGKYQQGKHRLKSNNGTFCCLGVLCEISGLGTWEGESLAGVMPPEPVYAVPGYDARGAFLSEPVCEWAGLKHATGGRSAQSKLSEMNDHGQSFSAIAQYIRENL